MIIVLLRKSSVEFIIINILLTRISEIELLPVAITCQNVHLLWGGMLSKITYDVIMTSPVPNLGYYFQEVFSWWV